MINYLSGSKSEGMYNYLYKRIDFPFKTNHFWFTVIDFNRNDDQKKILEFIEEIIPNVVFLGIDKHILMFYFEHLEHDFKGLFSGISDDFGISLKVFTSNKINVKYPNNFQIVYSYFLKYLSNKSYSYFDTTDLILEIIKNDIRDLFDLKRAILNAVYDDSQFEKLILAMFENDLNVTKTSKDIFMHRNTVINKLEYIKSETGLNIQTFTDALCMYWLIKAK